MGEEEDSMTMDSNSFITFSGCVAPLLRGVAALADVGCDLECYVVRVIGDTVKKVVMSVFATIVVSDLYHYIII